MCIAMMKDAFAAYPISRVFDLGTGSGVLALCALRLGATKILACDISLNACKEALVNLKNHGIPDKILLVRGTYTCARAKGFDLVLANLLMETLSKILPFIPPLLKNRGILILSGITPSQLDQLLSYSLGLGDMHLLKRDREHGWASAMLIREIQEEAQ